MSINSRHPKWMLACFCWATLLVVAALGAERQAESATADMAGSLNMAGAVGEASTAPPMTAWPTVALPKDLRLRESFSLGLVNGEQVQITCLKAQVAPISLWPSHLPQVLQQGQQSWPAILQQNDTPLAKAFVQLWPSHRWPDHFWTQLPMSRRWLLILVCAVIASAVIVFNPPYKIALSIVLLLALMALPSYQRSLGIVESGQIWRCSRAPSPADVLVYQTIKGEPLYFSVFAAPSSPNFQAQNLESTRIGSENLPALPPDICKFFDAHHSTVHASFWSELVLIQPLQSL